ncbi:ABC transporter substrate-binding protein [Nocardioides jensenii]|uniref:ABC transporter substrate-binding protein n=1 Tax=Nocardioides jensenii TaxID=1843 RepID=UPI00082E5A39
MRCAIVIRGAVLGTAFVLTLAGCAEAPALERKAADPSDGDYPVEVTSCGHTSTITARPTRAVTLNQGATEVVLALGLEDQLAGTAYLDDAVPPKWKRAYDEVPVLSKEYPTHEVLLKTQPDFVYASYASGFDKKVAGSQESLEKTATGSYLSPFGCDDEEERPKATFEAVWQEIDAIAAAFGEPEKAADFRAEQGETLEELAATKVGTGVDVLWFDSGDKKPFVGAGGGGPQLILDAVGATNIFADLDGGWADGNWEDVLAADPDVIVLADASWSTAEDKVAYLESDPVLSQLTAVKAEAYVTIPFSESTPGVRLADGAASVSNQLDELAPNP